jgi:purine-binding chemotaxis protein CheW
MDFLDIRKKAKERAQARSAEEAAGKVRVPAEKGGDREARPRAGKGTRRGRSAPPAPPPASVVTDQDLLDGALAARLQGIPAPPAEPLQGDARFTTWRPGAGAPPPLPAEDDGGISGLPGRDLDFTVGPAARAPVPPRREPVPRAREAEPTADPLDEFFYRFDEAAPALPQLAPAAEVPEPEPELMAREEYLTFMLGAEEYAIAIERVRQVIKAPPVTEVPRAPAHILGVVTVRGEVVAVLDPRRRLGLPPLAPAEGYGKVVIVDAGEGPCGLLVDRVASVVRLRPGSIEPCPQGISGSRSEFLAGIGRAGERLFTVLDLGALLRRTPLRADPALRARRADAGP